MRKRKRCKHCLHFFLPCPQVPHQEYCSTKKCQRARKQKWNREKLATDCDYRKARQEAQERWCEKNPGYWKGYRKQKKNYVKKNKEATFGQETFRSLGLTEPLLEAAEAISYKTPTPVQVRAIPAILEGRDLLGLANTGTGKTAAFLFPILQRLLLDHYSCLPKGVCSLILVPTRELARQIYDSVREYGQFINTLSYSVIVGGVRGQVLKRQFSSLYVPTPP